MTILASIMLPRGAGGGTRPGRKTLSVLRSHYQLEHRRDFAEHAFLGMRRHSRFTACMVMESHACLVVRQSASPPSGPGFSLRYITRARWLAEEVWPLEGAGRREGQVDDSAVTQADNGDESPLRDNLLLTVFFTPMSLQLAPYPCRCGTHEVDVQVPRYNGHRLGRRCPYAAEGFDPGRMGSCCSIWADTTAALLQEHGEVQAVERLYQSMTCAAAAAFSVQLSAIAERLVEEYLSTRTTEPDKRIILDKANGFIMYPLPEDLYLERILSSIVMVARWYELTAALHFGVDAARLFE